MKYNVNTEYSLIEDKVIITKHQSFPEEILDPDETEEWYTTKRSVNTYVKEVQWSFQLNTEYLKVVHNRLGNKNFQTVEECYEGFDPVESPENLNKSKAIAIENVQKFGEKIENRLHAECSKKVNIATGALLCATIGVLSHTLFASPTERPTSMITMKVIASAEAACAAIIGVYQAVSSHVLKNNTRRAMAYLEQVENNVEHISGCLTMSEWTKSGAIYDRALLQEEVKQVIERLNDPINLCNEVI